MKACSKCGQVKERSEFHKMSASRDGLKPLCKECHRAASRTRYASDPQRFCAQTKQWRTANPERSRELKRLRAARYYAADPAAAAAKVRTWNRANPDRVFAVQQRRIKSGKAAASLREWRKANPDKVRAQALRRRARHNGASGTATTEQMLARIAFYGGLCWMCGASADTIDHVIPLSRGGSNWPANLRPACRSCNCRKNDRLLSELRLVA